MQQETCAPKVAMPAHHKSEAREGQQMQFLGQRRRAVERVEQERLVGRRMRGVLPQTTLQQE